MNEAIHQTLAQIKERLGESMYPDQRRVQSTLGNASLLDLPKTAFLSSRKIAPAAVLRCYDWATAQRDTGRCVIGAFHSGLEKDVLHFLLQGKQPIVQVLARSLYRRPPEHLLNPLAEGRLLLVSAAPAASRVCDATARIRNRFILTHCDDAVIGSLNPEGGLAALLREFPALPQTLLDQGEA